VEVSETISFDEFLKLDLRIGEIKRAEPVPGADKLLQLTVDDGQGQRTTVAGIAQWYTPESLVGKKIVLLANLQPARIRGVQSQGMLLAADVGGTAIILIPDQDVPAGSKVR
jgi:methionyl-tRNA synthetase